MQIPPHWTEQEWLAFLLLTAAHADGVLHQKEARIIEVRLGPNAMLEAEQLRNALDEPARENVIRLGIAAFLNTAEARQRLQALLHQVFLADGDYSTGEQELRKKIGQWIAEADQ